MNKILEDARLDEIKTTYQKAYKAYDRYLLKWLKGAQIFDRVYNRKRRLKHLLEISAPEIIIGNEKKMIQRAEIIFQNFQNKMKKELEISYKFFDKAEKLIDDLPEEENEKYHKKLGKKLMQGKWEGEKSLVGENQL